MTAIVQVSKTIGVYCPSPLQKGQKAREIAFQKQCRDQYLDEGIPSGIDLSLDKSILREISFQKAKEIILKYEWLGRMSATKYHYALVFDPISADFGGEIGGVVCIGGQNCTGSSYTHKMYGIEESEVGVLARGACVHWAPKNSNSKLVGAAMRAMRKIKRYKIMLAYADPAAGEIGTIYQSCNWQYVGKTVPQFRMYKEGKSFDSAKIIVDAQKAGIRWKEMYQRYIDEGWIKVKGNSKYRYALVLDNKDKRLVDKVNSMSLPYPKRGDVL